MDGSSWVEPVLRSDASKVRTRGTRSRVKNFTTEPLRSIYYKCVQVMYIRTLKQT